MKSTPLNILLIEDNPADARLLGILLSEAEGNYQITHVERLTDGLSKLVDGLSVDVILLDFSLPDSQGIDSIHQLNEVFPNLPVVVLTGLVDEELAVQIVHEGAQDYLVKGSGDGRLIARSLRYAVERKHSESILERRASEMEAVYATSLEINSEVDIRSLLKAIVERATRLADLPLGAVYLWDEQEERLNMVVSYNLPAEYTKLTLRRGEGLGGKVMETARPITLEDYQTWENRAEKFEKGPFRRMIGMPLIANKRVIGAIVLAHDTQPGAIQPEYVRLVQLFADQAAIAVEKVRLLDAEQQRSRELKRSNQMIAALSQVASRLGMSRDPDLIMETVGNELKQLGVTIQISLFEQDQHGLVLRYNSIDQTMQRLLEKQYNITLNGLRMPENAWTDGHFLRSRQPVALQDPKEALRRSFPRLTENEILDVLRIAHIGLESTAIYLPLTIKERAIGVLSVWGEDIREDDVPAFTIFSNQVAIALDNARLVHEIQQLAVQDELTGLYNRRGFFTLGEQHLLLAKRKNRQTLLIFLDVDKLKWINDTYGHQEGDQALMDVAQVLKKTFRASDVIARMGGDEFAVMALESDRRNMDSIITRLEENRWNLNRRNGRLYDLEFSVGFAVWEARSGLSLDELLARADSMMYRQKRRNRGEDVEDDQ